MTDEEIDAIANDGHRNVVGGIYATSVYHFARAVRAHALEEAARVAEGRIGVCEPGIRPEDIAELDKEAQDIATVIRALLTP